MQINEIDKQKIEIEYYEEQRIKTENEVQTQECKQMKKTQIEKDVQEVELELELLKSNE